MSAAPAREAVAARLADFAGLEARVKFDLGEDGAVVVDATGPRAALADEAGEADCTIVVSSDNLRRLLAGELSPTVAYTTGKLKVRGAMGVAMKLAARLED